MATITKTFVEDDFSSNKNTWTTETTCEDIVVSNSTFNMKDKISFKAKHAMSSKPCVYIEVGFCLMLNGVIKNRTLFKDEGGYDIFGHYYLTANKFYSPVRTNIYSATINTSDVFNRNNPTTREIPVSLKTAMGICDGYYTLQLYSIGASSQASNANSYTRQSEISWGEVCNVILDAPPSCEYTQVLDVSQMNEWVQGKSIARTTISNSTAQYGGNVSSVKMTIGNSTAQISGNGNIDIPIVDSGTLTPQVSITDSRGQTTTYNLDPITVQAYNVPTISTFSIARENEHDVGGVTVSDISFVMNCGYTQMNGNALAIPTIKIDGAITQVSWYTDATRQTSYSGGWTGVSPLTLYGVASGMYQTINEYSTSATISDTFSTSEEKTEVLPTVFVTMDFQAGGKEIAFGDKADDSLTNHPNGLFKCAMDMTLRGTRVPSIFVSTNDPTSNDGEDGDIWMKYVQ